MTRGRGEYLGYDIIYFGCGRGRGEEEEEKGGKEKERRGRKGQEEYPRNKYGPNTFAPYNVPNS